MERVAGIEPARSAWKAEVLPLNYTRNATRPSILDLLLTSLGEYSDNNSRANGGGGKDSNLRSSQRIYSPSPLTAQTPP